ncbi:MAG: citrate/2-methylcitrate synthase, partial [bacterium]|nr:citrate/2-methylcitrate synthase [bacterium]
MSIVSNTNSSVREGEPTVGGESLIELISHATFADAVCLLLRGDRPSANERALLDAMLVAACTHGSKPPSSIAACTSASSGNPLHVAVAAGILGMGPRHGCAIELAMRVLLRADDPVSFVASCRAAGER